MLDATINTGLTYFSPLYFIIYLSSLNCDKQPLNQVYLVKEKEGLNIKLFHFKKKITFLLFFAYSSNLLGLKAITKSARNAEEE